MRESIFVVNAGSSSIKFSVLETLLDPSLRTGAHGQVEGIGASRGWRLPMPQAEGWPMALLFAEITRALLRRSMVFSTYRQRNGVGDRIVHGGLTYSEPLLIDAHVMAALESLKRGGPSKPHSEKISVRNLDFFYGESQALKKVGLPFTQLALRRSLGVVPNSTAGVEQAFRGAGLWEEIKGRLFCCDRAVNVLPHAR